MKKILFLATFSFSSSLFMAQVGINTQLPKATLDVIGKPSDSNVLDGIIVPRLTGDQLSAKNYTVEQTGALTYATNAATNQTGQVVNVANAGLYYFDGNQWIAGKGMNIYNTDGTLSGVRNLSQAGNTLTFTNIQKSIFANTAGSGLIQDSGTGTRASIRLTNGGTSSLSIFSDTNSTAQVIASGISTGLTIGTSSTTNASSLFFSTSPGGSSTGNVRAEIAGDGRFNIINSLSVGYSVPQNFSGNQRLKVNGSIVTSTNTYPDYVFENYFTGNSNLNSIYTFKTLSSVKDYVKNHHHLPGIFSIRDLPKNGGGYEVDLTRLSMQQLEKIEELYLHAIEQEEIINKQKSELQNLKSRLEKIEKLLTKYKN